MSGGHGAERWWERPLSVTLIGVVATAALTAAAASVASHVAQGRWMERADGRAAALERQAADAGRAVEALEATDGEAAARLAAIEAEARADRRILLRLEDKVDRLLQRQAGD